MSFFSVSTSAFPGCKLRVTPNKKSVAVYDCLAVMGFESPAVKWKELCNIHKLPCPPGFLFLSQDPTPVPVLDTDELAMLMQKLPSTPSVETFKTEVLPGLVSFLGGNIKLVETVDKHTKDAFSTIDAQLSGLCVDVKALIEACGNSSQVYNYLTNMQHRIQELCKPVLDADHIVGYFKYLVSSNTYARWLDTTTVNRQVQVSGFVPTSQLYQ